MFRLILIAAVLLMTGCQWPETKKSEFYVRAGELREYREAHPTYSREWYECRRDVTVRYWKMADMMSLKHDRALASCDYFLEN